MIPLELEVERDREGYLVVRAPAVGYWLGPPPAGRVCGPGSPFGVLRTAGTERSLRLPTGATGRVESSLGNVSMVAVEYGQALARLRPIDGTEEGEATRTRVEDPEAAAGRIAVRAPTDGVFYRRPGPDAAPFVRPGQQVTKGEVLGLIEVMKTFHQIRYEDPSGSGPATVVEVRGGDASEVDAGDVLVVLDPGTERETS